MPEERIFTIPAGQEIKVYLDRKELQMTFPEDMKLMSVTTAVRQEVVANNSALAKVKSDQKSKTLWTVVVSILGILGGLVGIIFGKSFWPKISGSIQVK